MFGFIATAWGSFKAKFPPNRVAVALCALVAGPLTIAGGDVAAWSAVHFPGLHLTGTQVTAAFVAGAAAVAFPLVTAAYKWFSGWIQHERAEQLEAAAEVEHKRQVELKLVDRGEHTATSLALEDATASTTATTVVPTPPVTGAAV